MSSSSESSVELSAVDSESDNFDPLKALYTENVPTSDRAHVYDNLQQFENYIKLAKEGRLKKHIDKSNARILRLANPSDPAPGAASTSASSSAAAATPALSLLPSSALTSADGSAVTGVAENRATAPAPATGTATTDSNQQQQQQHEQQQQQLLIPGRNFTVSQAPVKSVRRERKTVLTKMDTMVGPLARIKHYVDTRAKITVVTRNYSQVRGKCVGYIVAFDKHWNLCLSDVDETFQRRVHGKMIHPGGGEVCSVANTENQQKQKPRHHHHHHHRQQHEQQQAILGQLSKCSIVPSHKQQQQQQEQLQQVRRRPAAGVYQQVSRHVNQLFVRGDNVVCISWCGDNVTAQRQSERGGKDERATEKHAN